MHSRTPVLFLIIFLSTFGKGLAVSPAPKAFSIAGSPPMESISVETLKPSNAKHTKFRGSARLRLSGSSSLSLAAHLTLKKTKGKYKFASVSGFPKFKGTIQTAGEPESVTSVSLTLAQGKRNRVKDTNASGVMLAPPTTTMYPPCADTAHTFDGCGSCGTGMCLPICQAPGSPPLVCVVVPNDDNVIGCHSAIPGIRGESDCPFGQICVSACGTQSCCSDSTCTYCAGGGCGSPCP